MQTKVINLFGGPGTGKSTTAAALFTMMKLKEMNVELTGEFAKDLTWAERQPCMKCQPYLFGEQYYRIFRLLNKVEYIINDSPLLLSSIYNTQFANMDALVLEVFNSTDNINVFLERTERKYNPHGRNQDYYEAVAIDNKILNLLNDKRIPYLRVSAHQWAANEIFQHVVFKALPELTNL